MSRARKRIHHQGAIARHDAFWRGFIRGALIVYAIGGPIIVGLFLGSWLGN